MLVKIPFLLANDAINLESAVKIQSFFYILAEGRKGREIERNNDTREKAVSCKAE